MSEAPVVVISKKNDWFIFLKCCDQENEKKRNQCLQVCRHCSFSSKSDVLRHWTKFPSEVLQLKRHRKVLDSRQRWQVSYRFSFIDKSEVPETQKTIPPLEFASSSGPRCVEFQNPNIFKEILLPKGASKGSYISTWIAPYVYGGVCSRSVFVLHILVFEFRKRDVLFFIHPKVLSYTKMVFLWMMISRSDFLPRTREAWVGLRLVVWSFFRP